MSSGSLIAIGITALICTFGFGMTAVNPGSLAKNSTFFYSGTFFSLVLACSCFVPVINRAKNNKHKARRKMTISTARQARKTPGDFRSTLADFELNNLTLPGWILSSLSLIVFFSIASTLISSMENTGTEQALRSDLKVLASISLVVSISFFLAGKFILENLNIKIFKD